MKRLIAKAVSLFIALSWALGATTPAGAAPLAAATPQSESVPRKSTNHQNKGMRTSELPHPVFFREVRERGLLVKVWLNDSGPFTFAIDTGAGITLIADRVAAGAVTDQQGASLSIGGLSGVPQSNAGSNGRETIVRTIAIGDSSNLLAANQTAVIINTLPPDIDGILDPTEAYFPFGYSIDLPNHELAAFNPKTLPLNIHNTPEGGTVVRWLSNGSGRRPFVRLSDGRVALLDTGSGFGLAISQEVGIANGRNSRIGVQDIGGGAVTSRRADPSTVSIGALTLRGVPTDFLYGVEKDAPILLGRDALYPFRLTFDPLQRLIEIAPAKR